MIFFNSENESIIGLANLKNLLVTTPYLILFLSIKLINDVMPSKSLQPFVLFILYSERNSDFNGSNSASSSSIAKNFLISFDVPSEI